MTHLNYIVRKQGQIILNVKTDRFQLGLRPIKIIKTVEGLQQINPAMFGANFFRTKKRNEPELFDDYTPNLLQLDLNTGFSKIVTI